MEFMPIQRNFMGRKRANIFVFVIFLSLFGCEPRRKVSGTKSNAEEGASTPFVQKSDCSEKAISKTATTLSFSVPRTWDEAIEEARTFEEVKILVRARSLLKFCAHMAFNPFFELIDLQKVPYENPKTDVDVGISIENLEAATHWLAALVPGFEKKYWCNPVSVICSQSPRAA
jgi:hypothetical protein